MGQEKAIQVLIVDDDQEDAILLQRYLSRCQRTTIKTEYAADSHQAQVKLTEGHFDLILLDNRLGGTITAREVLESFWKDNIDVPVVIVTGQGDEQTAVELMKIGAYDYTTKDSLTTETLEKTILNTVKRCTLISRQKQTDEEIRHQKELLTNIISNIPHFVSWKDRDSVYLGCNKNFADIAGVCSVEDIVGKTDYELGWKKEAADFFSKYDKEVVEKNEPLFNMEESYIRADGREATLLTSKVPLKNKDGNVIGLLSVYTDITERKKTERTLEMLNKELGATVQELTISNRELQDFAHVVAHDLKSPLRAIGTLADWISTDHSNKLDETGQQHVKLLLTRAERMSNLIDGILTYSEIRHTKQKVEEVDLNLLLAEVISELGLLENITITVDSKLPTTMCEKTRMRQVFQNLLSNAVEYMDKPKGLIRVNCLEEDGFWKFSVADNGPGIKQKYFEKVFKIFQTLLPRDEIERIGIGLTIARKIVELWGGNIWVESEVGTGSTFFFTLPKLKRTLKMLTSKPILLVEDDRVDVMSIKRAFKDLEITNKLIHAVNGEEALEYLTNEGNEKPCIILLDLSTPRMDGIEFLRITKGDEELKKIPVIVLTTSSGEQDILDSFNLGAAGYMVKSVNYKKFLETMRVIDSYWTLSRLPVGDEVTDGKPA